MEQPQYIREALAEIIRAVSECPKGSDVIMGRGFDIIAGPIKDIVMAVCGGDREELEESAEELRQCRASLRALGAEVSP